jgi:hypothetical protein
MVAQERTLLIARENGHTPLRVWIAERGEDPTSNPKVGMAVVRLFDRILEAERYPPKSRWRHAPIMA